MQTLNPDRHRQQPESRLLTKRAFISENIGFLKYGALNWILFKHMSELRARAVVLKIGPKQLFIDENAFKAWIREKSLETATQDGVYDNDA